jgi:type IV secretory pathway TrbD component
MSTPQTAPTISLQYQTPLLSPLETRYIVLHGHPHRYVSVPGTLQGFLEIGVRQWGGGILLLLLHNSCAVCTHPSDLKTSRVKVRAHLCKRHTHTHTHAHTHTQIA